MRGRLETPKPWPLFWCGVIALSQFIVPVASAQDYTLQEHHDIYPQNLWTYDRPVGHHYSSDQTIRGILNTDLVDRSWPRKIVIDSESLGDYLQLFRDNEIRRLQVVNATNEDIAALSQLHSLEDLALPCCKANDFLPLTKLAKVHTLAIANPNLRQIRERQLLNSMKALKTLTLYNANDLQEAVDLPGLEQVATTQRAPGLFTLIVQAPKWNPRSQLTWPKHLQHLPVFSVLGDRIRLSYSQQQRADIYIGRYRQDDPALCSTRLRDAIDKSGFYDNRHVVCMDLTSRHVSRDGWQPEPTYDKTDLSPLKAFPKLKYLTLEGNFYGYESLTAVALEWIRFTEQSPFPSEQAVRILSEHPTLKKVEKNIYSATYEVLFQSRRDLPEPKHR